MTRLLTAAALAALSVAVAAPAVAQDFRALARQDLQAARDELAANHPASVIDAPASQSFRQWIDAGLQDALSKVNQVNSGDSHAYLLRYYGAGFRDANIRISPSFEGLGPYFATSWPGYTTGWRNGRYEVTWVKPGLRGAPAVGSVVTECNGVPIEDFAKEKLDRWEGDLTTEAGRVRSAPYLLWNRNNPFTRGVPSTCKFQTGRGRPRDIAVAIQPVDRAALEQAYRATVYMPGAQPLGVETVNGRPWVNVHSFADDAGWPAFNAAVEAAVEQLRGPQGFVLDLRGAAGSGLYNSAARGYGLANRIWTPEFTVSRQPAAGEITYRASPGNRQWFAETLGRMEADQQFAHENWATVLRTREIVKAFDAAIAAGQQTFSLPVQPVADTGAANPVQGPVVVLVDSGCSGGCLDMLDLLSRLPNVRIAGNTTAADSVFLDPTVKRLPSNYSDLGYGHSAWINRPRGNMQPFTPAQGLAYTGAPADEAAVRAWVATLFN